MGVKISIALNSHLRIKNNLNTNSTNYTKADILTHRLLLLSVDLDGNYLLLQLMKNAHGHLFVSTVVNGVDIYSTHIVCKTTSANETKNNFFGHFSLLYSIYTG